jgi:PhnB protein
MARRPAIPVEGSGARHLAHILSISAGLIRRRVVTGFALRGGRARPDQPTGDITMPELDSYLFFDGNCAQAMRFYESALGGKLEMMMTYSQSPDPQHCPAGSEDRIMHASLTLGGRRLMASDTPTNQPNPGMHGFSLSLSYPTVDEARRVFDKLGDGGKVIMPLDKTFWADAFGMLTDRFGTPWMVSGGANS